jgi:hypothetical protein
VFGHQRAWVAIFPAFLVFCHTSGKVPTCLNYVLFYKIIALLFIYPWLEGWVELVLQLTHEASQCHWIMERNFKFVLGEWSRRLVWQVSN